MKNALILGGFVLSLAAAGAGASKDKDDSLYSSFGKRDPFRVPDRAGLGADAPVDPVRKYRLESYRLRAILRISGKPQAMFEDPDGRSHVVNEHDRIGMEGARVSRIVDSEVIVTERSSNYLGKEILLEKVLSLPSDTGVKNGGGSGGNIVQQSFGERDTASQITVPAANAEPVPATVAPAPMPAPAPAPTPTPVGAAEPAAPVSATPNYLNRSGQ